MPVVTRSQKKNISQQHAKVPVSVPSQQPHQYSPDIKIKMLTDKINAELDNQFTILIKKNTSQQHTKVPVSVPPQQPHQYSSNSKIKNIADKIKEEVDKQKKVFGSEEKIKISNKIYEILLKDAYETKYKPHTISHLYMKTLEVQDQMKNLDKTHISTTEIKRFMVLTNRFKQYAKTELKGVVITASTDPIVIEAKTQIDSLNGLRRSNRITIPTNYAEYDVDTQPAPMPTNLRRSQRIKNLTAVNYAETDETL